MLRIGPNGQLPMAPSSLGPMMDPANSGEDQSATGSPDSTPKGGRYSMDKVPQANAGYLGPEDGPFECGNCQYFSAPSSCHVVDGQISEDGCCNNFVKGGNDPDADDDSDDDSGDPMTDGTPEEGGQGV